MTAVKQLIKESAIEINSGGAIRGNGRKTIRAEMERKPAGRRRKLAERQNKQAGMDRILGLLIYAITALAGVSEPLSRLGIGSFERWERGKKIKILLVGYNGARNTGSDVRVTAIAGQIRKLFGPDKVKITVMTLNAAALEGYFDEDVDLLTFSSLFPMDLFRACTSHHAVILCEGSTLKSTFANGLTLFMCEAAGIMAAQKKPCIAYGSEVGEMEPFLKKAAARLCRNTYFIARTKGSLEALRKIGLKGHQGTDAAWSYDGSISQDKAKQLLRQQGWDGKALLLGVAVIDPFCWPVRASLGKWIKGIACGDLSDQYDKWYFFSRSAKRSEAFERYIEGMAKGVNAFAEKTGCFPVLLGMESLDEKACKALRAGLRKDGAVFLSGNTDAGIMTGILRSLSFLVTSRYHAAVLGMEGGCPVIAVSMDERLDGLMRELFPDDRYLFHVSDSDLGEKIYKALEEAEKNSVEISKRITGSLKGYRNILENMGGFMKRYIEKGIDRA